MTSVSQSNSYDRKIHLKAFDEGKTGVKGLVDAGAEKIPSIFVRSHEDISKDFHTCQESLAIPVIDLTHVRQRNSQGEEIIRRVIWASEKWGFFQVVNHGIPVEILDKVIEGVRMFHEQDAEVKKELYSRDDSRQVRFNSNLDLYKSRAANWRDTLYVSTVFRSELEPQLLPPICRYNCFLSLIDIFSESLYLHLCL